ncbi:MAG: diguanylate cyclase [Rhodocyclaceae bacterium]|nr:diguanylate cyclase [Rhodocyclaceae bacterium]MBR4877725.1 diguanylate cyclase [Rhodocyclaceae bacterium]
MDNNDSLQQELRALREELAQVQSRYDFIMRALEHLPNPIFIKDADARFTYFNTCYAEAFGMERERYLGKSVLDLDYLPHAARERYQEEDLGLIQSASVVTYEVDFKFADGRLHPSLYWSKGFHDEDGNPSGLIGEIVDISRERNLQDSLGSTMEKLRESNLQLQRLSEIDTHTGVHNRRFLNKRAKEFDESHSEEVHISCGLMCDLDHFKRVNDRYGHLKGDEILARFASILQNECRESDLPVRYGGEEFLLLLGRVNLQGGVRVAERIRRRCEQEILLPDSEPVTVSIGVSEIDKDQSLEHNIATLDRRMYLAKKNGRNCVIAEG